MLLQVLPPVHMPALQVWPPAQTPQVRPAFPHAEVDVPPRHTSPMQQPSQFSELQLPPPPVQRPLLQLCPELQVVQLEPPEPQVAVVRPVSQRLPLQQPWQLLGLQVLPVHWLSLQVPFEHALHAWPPLPHALARLPGMQTPFEQQPPQVAGPQELVPPPPPIAPPPVPPPMPPPIPPPALPPLPPPLPPPVFPPRGMQKPTLQNVSVPHWAQARPPEPQAFSNTPGRHSSVSTSQQPLQLVVLHLGTVVVVEHAAPRPRVETRERIRRSRITAT